MRSLFRQARAPVSLLLGACMVAACTGTPDPGGDARPGVRASANPGVIPINVVLTSGGYGLAGPKGMTLYILTKDKNGVSTCTTGRCAEAWAALKGGAAQVQVGAGVPGTFGTTIWADGTTQITHDGQPLYYFHQDQLPGEAKGQGRGGVWCVAPVAYATCAAVVAPGDADVPTFRAPGPANHASETSRGEY